MQPRDADYHYAHGEITDRGPYPTPSRCAAAYRGPMR